MHRQHQEMYRIIVKKNLKDQDGQSLLHYAASKHKSQIYKMIMFMAEDKNPKDKNEWNPLYIAAESGDGQ